MADRNLASFFRGGRFSTREGMLLEIPPSGFDWQGVGGIPSVIDPFAVATAQVFPLGTKLTYGERMFRYAKNGGTLGVTGNLYQAVVPLAGHLDEVIGTNAIGDKTVDFTPNTVTTDDLTANELQDGYFWVISGTGLGQMLRIKSHPAITGAVLGVLTLVDPFYVATAAASKGSVIHNTYRAVIIHPASDPTAETAGVMVAPIAANGFGWLQTHGPCSVLMAASVLIDDWCVPSTGTAGAVMPSAAIETDGPAVGQAMAISGTAEHAAIRLTIE